MPLANFKSVQFLRFAAAFLVALSHAEYLSGLHWPRSKTASYIFGLGACGVHIFFVISGFVMVYATFSRSPDVIPASTFLWRRFVRIFPIYWLYLLACYFIDARPFRALDAIAAALLLPGYSSLIIGQGWTLSYEIYFYICFAATIWMGKNFCVVALTVFFVASILQRKVMPNDAFFDIATNSLLLEFIAGALIAGLVIGGIRSPTHFVTAALLLFFIGLVSGYDKLPSVITWGIPSAMLIFGCVSAELNNSLPIIIRRLSFLGDSSYSLYLLHAILIEQMLIIFGHLPVEAKYIVIALLACVCCCVASLAYAFLERPIVRYLAGVKAK